jgi:capsular polysaccharide biosynthesis protein
MDIRFHMARLMQQLHWLLVFGMLGVAGGAAFMGLRAPTYVATARILVESEQIPGDLAPSTVRLQTLAQLELTLQRILARDSLLQLAARKAVYQTAPLSPHDLVRDLRARIAMTHAPGRDAAPLVSVTFKGPSAQLAADVANDIADMILQDDVATRTQTARKTLEFFTQDVARLEAELAAQDAEILAFRQQNANSLPDSLAFRRSQQTTGQERLLQVEKQIGNLQDRRAKAQRHQKILAAAATKGSQSNEALQLAQLEEHLATQSTLFSADNPRVKMLRSQVKGLHQRLETVDDTAAIPDPLTSYEIERAEVDADLAELAARKTRILASIAALATSIQATPSNAITLGNLERAQANTRLQHDQAVANKVRAHTGKMIETLRQGQHISLFEAAVPPLHPKGPRRTIALAAGLAFGLFAGLVFVFLRDHLSKRIRHPADISGALGITPFATLPYQHTRAEKQRRRRLAVAAAVMLLAGLPAGFWAIQTYYGGTPITGSAHVAAALPKPQG